MRDFAESPHTNRSASKLHDRGDRPGATPISTAHTRFESRSARPGLCTSHAHWLGSVARYGPGLHGRNLFRHTASTRIDYAGGSVDHRRLKGYAVLDLTKYSPLHVVARRNLWEVAAFFARPHRPIVSSDRLFRERHRVSRLYSPNGTSPGNLNCSEVGPTPT